MNKRGQIKMDVGRRLTVNGKQKNGQVTLFVIIAIIIVVGMGAFYMFRGEKGSGTDMVSADMSPIKTFVDSCLEPSFEKYTYIVGEGGGYIFAPLGLSDQDGITYYYLDGEIYFPTKKEIESRLSNAIRAEVLLCVNNFKLFPGKEIETGKLEVKVEILDEFVKFNVEYPIIVKVGEETSTFSDFGEHIVPVRLGLMHSVIETLIRQNVFSSESICLSCFAEAAFENNLSIDFLEGGSEGSIFIFEDKTRPIVDVGNASLEDYEYEFGSEFMLGVEEEGENRTFRYMFASD